MSDSSRLKKSFALSTSSSCSTSSFSSDEENDNKSLKPIKDYLSNKRDLARQLFQSVKIDKIRLMLPQTLKKVELAELEEWCASELSGMSKSRILSILNGTPMLYSSATSESDDSGPSLEIISDTEAWITDNDSQIQSTSSKTVKTKTKKKRKVKVETVKVKKEGANGQVKPQEGESLLDLLELEMRARAIRALIRKEEYVVNPLNAEQKNMVVANAMKHNITAGVGSLDDNNSNSGVINSQTGKFNKNKHEDEPSTSMLNVSLDEDLVLVVKPTPMISLLSSDGDSDESTKNKSKARDNKSINHVDDPIQTNIPLDVSKPASTVDTDREKSLTVVNKTSAKSHEPQNIVGEKTNENNKLSIRKIDDNVRVIKKIKKKTNLRTKSKSTTESISSFKDDEKIEKPKPSSKPQTNPAEISKNTELAKEEIEESEKHILKILASSTDADFGEIIDLDDYPDDMDEIENDGKIVSSVEKPVNTNNINIDQDRESGEKINLTSGETWASRYYQTDSVQNVIKESKIQSEIRKRLRERQKLSKLNTSLKAETVTTGVDANKDEIIEPKPTGSVEEYLAIKGVAGTTSNVITETKTIAIVADTDNTINDHQKSTSVNETGDQITEDIKLP